MILTLTKLYRKISNELVVITVGIENVQYKINIKLLFKLKLLTSMVTEIGSDQSTYKEMSHLFPSSLCDKIVVFVEYYI